jgi:diamine N-acetyltransferase
MNEKDKFPEVTLRAIEPEDLELLYHIENDDKLWNVGITNVPYSRFILHDYIANTSGDIYTDKQVRLMIENSEKKCVGMLDLVNFNPQHRRAEVGIVIMSEFRNLGFAKAALRKILVYCHNVIHLSQIYAIIRNDNKISLSLFKSLGFSDKTHLEHWLFDGEKYYDAVLMQFFLEKIH